jgi:superfamily I DNA and/or RNA helicase
MNFDFEKYLATQYEILAAEKRAQEERFNLDLNLSSLKEMKKNGSAIHPLRLRNKSFLSDETPLASFDILYDGASNLFKAGTPILCFWEQEYCEAQVVYVNDKQLEVALRVDSFPDWIEEKGVGVKLAPDEHTFELMFQALSHLKELTHPILKWHLAQMRQASIKRVPINAIYHCSELNSSQNEAVNSILHNEGIQILHGPPGTGKTTTLSHAIHALVKSGKRILVSAPSNTAVDHFAKALVKKGVKILRVGNHIKIDDAIMDYTLDGFISSSNEQKQIRFYQKKIEELRKKAGQFKRVFDKEAREERSACYAEIKMLRHEIKSLRKFVIEKIKTKCEVILGTPVGLREELGVNYQTDYVFIDEAGQCHDAMAWLLAPYARNWILAGDIHQLPPTYLAPKNINNPVASSILHNLQNWISQVYFLDTQYRMEPRIADFSNLKFYENRLMHFKPKAVQYSILFYDTAGMGYEETEVEETGSLFNEGEIALIASFLESPENQNVNWAVISPYQAQVDKLQRYFGSKIRIATIDSFQGQEAEGVILSLVRSNENQDIGFLRDYRRMNVAMTRAQDRLVVFGDSATIGSDEFYGSLLDYCEALGAYRSAFELL